MYSAQKQKSGKMNKKFDFLGKTPNVSITLENPVKSITIGSKVSDDQAGELLRCCKQKGISVNYE